MIPLFTTILGVLRQDGILENIKMKETDFRWIKGW